MLVVAGRFGELVLTIKQKKQRQADLYLKPMEGKISL